MKKFVNKILLSFILLFALVTNVKAAGSTSATYTTSGALTKGSTISVNININSVTGSPDGKLFSFGGYVSYDPEYLEYVSFEGKNGFTGSVNTDNNKIALADYTMSVGASSGVIGTIKFKALKTGTTTLDLTTASSTDSSSNLTTTFTAKSITITEPQSSNSKLSSLEVVGQSLSPSFNKNTTSYTVTVPEDATSVTINATAEDSKSTVTGTGTVTLSGNSTTAKVKVTAENGTSTTYTITIKKQQTVVPEPDKSNDSTLKILDVEGYTLTPTFKPSTTSYSMKVKNSVTSLEVEAVPNDPNATVTIEGNSDLEVGKNAITILVTAEDGTSTTYTVNVTRGEAVTTVGPKSSDKDLEVTILSPHTITPSWSNSIEEYEIIVPYEVTKLKYLIKPHNPNTTYWITGNNDFELDVRKLVTMKVTAEDGSYKIVKLYVTRTREKAQTDLLDLRVVGHRIEPDFKPEITEYTLDIDYKVKDLEVVAKTQEGSTAEITGNKDLKVGKNIILVKVTDKNGYIKYYQITVNKADKKAFTIFGMSLLGFLLWLLLLLLLLLLLILLLMRRNKEERKEVIISEKSDKTPVSIEFKPEFNFSSKNGTDDDILYTQDGNITTGVKDPLPEPNKEIKDADVKEVKYDLYDDVVTKEELIDAINESLETNNTDKLRMLLDQENLNRRKEEMKKQEEQKKEDR